MAATRLSFSYPQEMKDALVELAKKDVRHLSGYVQKILNEHIEKCGVSIKSGKSPEQKKKKKRKKQ